MAKPLLPDDLWEIIKPILPEWTPSPKGGQPRLDDRKALMGILFVLKTGIPWEDLPQEMGCGCGMTCWRRLRDWQASGIWDRIHKVLLDRLRKADKIDWSRAIADSSSVRAAYGGEATGPNPVDRAKPGTKHHALTDGVGVPLATTVTGANTHDVTELLPLVDAIPPVTGKPGSPRSRPDAVLADRAYDSEPHREASRQRGIEPMLARRQTPHGSGLGVYRWVVERTIGWLHQNRRLRIRYERRADIHQAFLTLACIKACFSVLQATYC
jgi:transposase